MYHHLMYATDLRFCCLLWYRLLRWTKVNTGCVTGKLNSIRHHAQGHLPCRPGGHVAAVWMHCTSYGKLRTCGASLRQSCGRAVHPEKSVWNGMHDCIKCELSQCQVSHVHNTQATLVTARVVQSGTKFDGAVCLCRRSRIPVIPDPCSLVGTCILMSG